MNSLCFGNVVILVLFKHNSVNNLWFIELYNYPSSLILYYSMLLINIYKHNKNLKNVFHNYYCKYFINFVFFFLFKLISLDIKLAVFSEEICDTLSKSTGMIELTSKVIRLLYFHLVLFNV